jgi:hypothetical protein
VFVAYVPYWLVHRSTENDRALAVRNGEWLLRWEQRLGLDWERGAQNLIVGHGTLVHAANVVYTWGFWPLVVGTLLALYLRDRTLFRRFRNAVLISGVLGLVVFALFPVAPPRMLAGFVDTVDLDGAGEIAHPSRFANEFGAMPSFHVGWLVLAGVVAMRAVPSWRWARPLLLLPAAVMLGDVMATANHYLVDGIAGATVALGGLAAARWVPTDWRRLPARLGADPAFVVKGLALLVSGRAAFAHRQAVGRPAPPPAGEPSALDRRPQLSISSIDAASRESSVSSASVRAAPSARAGR